MRILRPYRSLLATCLLLIAPTSYGQPGTVAGKVTDAESGAALAGVNVRLGGTIRGTVSDAAGSFRIAAIEPGRYSLSFSSIGFRPEMIADLPVLPGDTLILDIRLTPVALQTEPVVVIANKREQSLQDVPVSISVMEGKTIEDYNLPSVEDALRYISGVNVVDAQVSIRGSSGYSRGAGSRVLMLVDGLPLLTGDTGELNFETIPVFQVDRLEVAKGAGSALYGSNALGGVINVITKPLPETPLTTIRLSGGIYDGPSHSQWDWGGGTRFTDNVTLTHGQTFGSTGLGLHVSRTGDEGYRQNDHRNRYNGYVKVRHEFSEQDALTATANILHQARGSFLNWKDLSNALVPPDIQQGDWIESDRFFVSARHQHVASENFRFSVSGIWYHNLFRDNIDTVTHRSESDMMRAEVQATWSPHPSHLLTGGIEGIGERVEADLFGNRRGRGVGLYAQDEIRLDESFRLTVGARYDYHDLDSLDSDSQLSPKAAVLYVPSSSTRIRGSVGRGFRSPTAAEAFTTTTLSVITIIPNPALRSERSTSFEVGWNQLIGSSMMIDVALFQSDFSDLIEPRFVAGTTGQFVNVTRARVRGIEVNWVAELFARSLLLSVGYTHTDPKDLTEDDVLKYRHRHLLSAGLTWQHGTIMAGLDYRYQSRVERIDEEFAIVIPDAGVRVPVSVFDVRTGVTFVPTGLPLSLMFNIRNLFQYNYVDFIGNLAPPRTYSLTAEITL